MISVFTQGTQFIMCLNAPELQQFKEILDRGLNTAPPDKYPDWYLLADKLLEVRMNLNQLLPALADVQQTTLP